MADRTSIETMILSYRFTPAQRRALDWLPSDGSWSGPADDLLRYSLDCLADMNLARAQWGDRSTPWRLTPVGMAVKAEIERAEAEKETKP